MKFFVIIFGLLLLGSVYGIQESFAELDSSIVKNSEQWIPELLDTKEIKEIYTDENNDLWILIGSKNPNSTLGTNSDTRKNAEVVIHVQTNPIPSYLVPTIMNEQFEDVKYTISMNYLDNRIVIASLYFDQGDLRKLGTSMDGWKKIIHLHENKITDFPNPGMYKLPRLRGTGTVNVGPDHILDLSSLDIALEQAYKNRENNIFDPLLIPKFIPNGSELKIVEYYLYKGIPKVKLWLAPTNFQLNDFGSLQDFHDYGGKTIVIQHSPFKLDEYLRPSTGFIVRDGSATGWGSSRIELYDSNFKIELRSSNYDTPPSIDDIKTVASIVSESSRGLMQWNHIQHSASLFIPKNDSSL